MLAPPSTPQRAAQCGVSLLEVLIGFALLSFALLAAAHLHITLRQNAEFTRHRTEALHIAQSSLEATRSQPAGSAPTDQHAGPAAGDGVAVAGQTTRYVLRQQLSDPDPTALRSAAATVDWTDRQGVPGQVALHTRLHRLLPVYSAVLSLAPAQAAPLGRPFSPGEEPSAAVDPPPLSQPLGKNRVLWVPPGANEDAYVLDLATGQVAQRCTMQSIAGRPEVSTAQVPGACSGFQALLLQGYVRFAAGGSPDPLQANDPPLPFVVQLSPEPASPPRSTCHTRALKTVQYTADGVQLTRPVDLHAQAPLGDTRHWTETAERFTSYWCLMAVPAGQQGWSGRWTLHPQGWQVGATAGTRKICRYSTDIDMSGSIDQNPENPARYEQLATSLTRQNYLVIRGDLPCPHGGRSSPHNGSPADTVQHQP